MGGGVLSTFLHMINNPGLIRWHFSPVNTLSMTNMTIVVLANHQNLSRAHFRLIRAKPNAHVMINWSKKKEKSKSSAKHLCTLFVWRQSQSLLLANPVRKLSWQYKQTFLDATEKFKRSLWRVCGALGFAGDERSASWLYAARKEWLSVYRCMEGSVWVSSQVILNDCF